MVVGTGVAMAIAGALHACGGTQTTPVEPQPTGNTPPVAAQDVATAPAPTPTSADDAGPTAASSEADAGAAATATGDVDGGAASSTAAAGGADGGSAYTGPRPYVFLRPPRVGVGLVGDQVARVFRRNHAGVERCYTDQLATNAHAHGVLTIRVTVLAGGTGTINGVRMAPRNQTLESCVQTAGGSWEWPAPRGGAASVDVTMTVDLAPTPPAPGHH
jgi:hypothetical protein